MEFPRRVFHNAFAREKQTDDHIGGNQRVAPWKLFATLTRPGDAPACSPIAHQLTITNMEEAPLASHRRSMLQQPARDPSCDGTNRSAPSAC